MIRNKISVAALALCIAFSFAIQAQNTAAPDPPERQWRASWVTHPTAPLREPIVLHFRRTLSLPSVPASYLVRVSADNRFILYVNGRRVGEGPARGDLAHWRYERFDLAPLLHAGQNAITATVWNWGVFAPLSQMSDRTAFLLESEATGATGISTPEGWQVEIEPGHKALDRSSVNLKAYFAAGPGEQIDAAKYHWNWQEEPAASSNWVAVATPMRDAMDADNSRGHSASKTGNNAWDLVPDGLPPMEYSSTSAGALVRMSSAEGVKHYGRANQAPSPEIAGTTIPPHSHTHLMLDRETLTTAYPALTVSGGKGAHVWLTYSEALYDNQKHKGDRNDVGDRVALGLRDSFLPDGGAHRTFEPLWWRTWRYLDLDIETADDPLTIESLKASFTAYPFQERATFESPNPDLKQIWEISWRTARLDAHETYMDTPYYEQLQYVGDTRIQALISYTVANDDRLARQALSAFDYSRFPDGITRSRYPSSLPQTIPTFSLLWIGMVRDYWMYRPDPEPARELLPGTRSVLAWFAHYEQPDGLLKELPWWSFIDWVPSGTIPTYDAKGESCVTTLQYLGALEDQAALETGLGDPQLATRYQARATHVRSGLYTKCWNSERGMLADTPERNHFSQQANILAVLFDVVPKEQQREVMQKVLAIEPGTTPNGILSASYYFRFYLARALEHIGMADSYLDSISPWRKLLPLHFSTWPEIPGNTRSDSHAWTSHPIYDLLSVVSGIEPASPSFATVRVAPHPGSLPSFTATFPHPDGTIRVQYTRMNGGFRATVLLPDKLTGNFEFEGKTWPLKPGENAIQTP
jgi:alpha-L-rhamnosidase